ncbi:unnamed protein product [Protopolystoma xenopodis]|uniref:Uncharacterized protein n=1 Tax=Protopolystoma xenopodis TaxID=117903 RepID=A0A448XD79_9PLAT|nr:unnamed protein product [Protopolystoma xenopodis]
MQEEFAISLSATKGYVLSNNKLETSADPTPTMPHCTCSVLKTDAIETGLLVGADMRETSHQNDHIMCECGNGISKTIEVNNPTFERDSRSFDLSKQDHHFDTDFIINGCENQVSSFDNSRKDVMGESNLCLNSGSFVASYEDTLASPLPITIRNGVEKTLNVDVKEEGWKCTGLMDREEEKELPVSTLKSVNGGRALNASLICKKWRTRRFALQTNDISDLAYKLNEDKTSLSIQHDETHYEQSVETMIENNQPQYQDFRGLQHPECCQQVWKERF